MLQQEITSEVTWWVWSTGRVTMVLRALSVSFQVVVPIWINLASRPSTFLRTNSALKRRCSCPQWDPWVPLLARVP